jgi:hypothetical protein
MRRRYAWIGGEESIIAYHICWGLGTVPADFAGSSKLIFYNNAEDAIYKALGGGIRRSL